MMKNGIYHVLICDHGRVVLLDIIVHFLAIRISKSNMKNSPSDTSEQSTLGKEMKRMLGNWCSLIPSLWGRTRLYSPLLYALKLWYLTQQVETQYSSPLFLVSNSKNISITRIQVHFEYGFCCNNLLQNPCSLYNTLQY